LRHLRWLYQFPFLRLRDAENDFCSSFAGASLIFLDMMTGLRRGEMAGLKWEDIDFLNLQINVSRSVVEQHGGRCKTEISQQPVPIDEYIAADLLEWYRRTPYHAASDWVFATDSNRAGEKRGKQPLWLCKVMCYHVQPNARELGIDKRIGWHTFRRSAICKLLNMIV
jgi:integrase